MFGTVLGRALRSLRANRWNQDRTESTANRKYVILCKKILRWVFIRCLTNSQILAQQKT